MTKLTLKELEEKRNALRKKFQKDIQPIDAQISKINDEKNLKEKQKFIGRFFRFKNSYGDKDKWFVYIKVLSASLDGFSLLKIEDKPETDYADGILELILTEEHHFSFQNEHPLFEQEITESEFDSVFKKAMSKIQDAGAR